MRTCQTRDKSACSSRAFPYYPQSCFSVQEERARELAGEGIRWLDLKRTGKLMEYTKLRNPDIINLVNSGIDPFWGTNGHYKILWPIPLSAIALDSGEYPQKPDYQ